MRQLNKHCESELDPAALFCNDASKEFGEWREWSCIRPATTLKGKKEGRRELKELWREGEVSFAARRQLFLSFCNGGGCIAARAHLASLEDKYSPHVIGIAEMRQRGKALGLAGRSLSGSTAHPFMACTWLRDCCRLVEAEMVSNSRNKVHQTWSIDFR